MIVFDPSEIKMDAPPDDHIDEHLHGRRVECCLQEGRIVETRGALRIVGIGEVPLQQLPESYE